MIAARQNEHSIAIHTSSSTALFEIIRWGEAPWWPKRSLMRFTRLSPGAIQKGTRYRQEVLLPFAPSWEVEVQALTSESITRKFLDGMFSGTETVAFKEAGRLIDIDYRMEYEIQGFANRVLWNLIFERLHNANIEAILLNLKRYLEENNYKSSKIEERR